MSRYGRRDPVGDFLALLGIVGPLVVLAVVITLAVAK